MKPRSLYLADGWCSTDCHIEVTNPGTGESLGQVCTLDRPAVAKAIADAATAFGGWRSLTALERGNYLRRLADEVLKRRDEIAKLITQENGKPLAQSLGEVGMTVDHLLWFAEEARRVYGRTVPHQLAGKRHMVIRTPIGVVGAIAPWNFPLVLAVRKIAPALAAGCPVVLKPASATPLSSLVFAECVEAAGIPSGVFQIVLGSSADIAAEFLTNPACRKVTFTGSTEVGRKLIAGAAEDIKPLSLELGGHAPFLVFADADLDQAVEGAIIAKFRNTGQSCIAASRIYVERSCYEEFLTRFVKRVEALKVGEGLTPGMDVGPVIDEPSLQKALDHIADATKRGARVLAGGNREGQQGHFLQATVLADVPADADCMIEETFAPVAPVVAFDTEAEAIERANDSRYGLSAYAYTRDVSRVFRLMEALEAGTLGINDAVPTASQCPFGGVKQSGWGRELGSEGLDAFLETKHASLGLEI